MRRVVLLPLSAPVGTTTDAVAAFDAVFAAELLKENRFEVVTISRADFRRHFGRRALVSSAALPHDLLPWLQREFEPDAVVLVDLTSYRPYHPLVLGLARKLALMDGSRLPGPPTLSAAIALQKNARATLAQRIGAGKNVEARAAGLPSIKPVVDAHAQDQRMIRPVGRQIDQHHGVGFEFPLEPGQEIVGQRRRRNERVDAKCRRNPRAK